MALVDLLHGAAAVRIAIEPLILPNGFPTLVHISLEDRTCDSAVIEYLAGKATIHHDRRFTVMTNEPTYDKQIENLKRYRTFGGDKPLPGERTPTDRFVRVPTRAETPAGPGRVRFAWPSQVGAATRTA